MSEEITAHVSAAAHNLICARHMEVAFTLDASCWRQGALRHALLFAPTGAVRKEAPVVAQVEFTFAAVEFRNQQDVLVTPPIVHGNVVNTTRTCSVRVTQRTNAHQVNAVRNCVVTCETATIVVCRDATAGMTDPVYIRPAPGCAGRVGPGPGG